MLRSVQTGLQNVVDIALCPTKIWSCLPYAEVKKIFDIVCDFLRRVRGFGGCSLCWWVSTLRGEVISLALKVRMT